MVDVVVEPGEFAVIVKVDVVLVGVVKVGDTPELAKLGSAPGTRARIDVANIERAKTGTITNHASQSRI